MTTLAWTILFLPLAAAVLIFFFLLRAPKLAGWTATGSLFTGFLLTLYLLLNVGALREVPLQSSITWIPLGETAVEFGVLVNGLSLLMLLIVTGIGSLIFLYSTAYMEHDDGYARYFASLSLFAFSMLGIVLSNNLIQIFIFWELVGLSSYLLIGFWFQKPEAATAGKKAFLTTRVGDVGMMIGILLIFGYGLASGAPTFNFLTLEETLTTFNIPAAVMTAIALLIFMGVMGKSAQVPLHVWLPDAMEGPTPVSALIHAATMVAAGVFLLARVAFLFHESPDALTIISWIGGITALLAGTIAVAQNDIKKILAYSTLSQLGYMVMALGLGNTEAGMFHLTTHAFFKALLFLGAGSLIHGLHTQNIWEMNTHGSLFKKMPVTAWTFIMGTAALIGLPPFAGFFSKEAILAAATHSTPLLAISLATVFFTAFYMGRLCGVVFWHKEEAHPKHDMHAVHESGFRMALPLAILGIFSIASGFFPMQEFLGGHHEAHHAGGEWLMFTSIGLAVAGFALAVFIYRKAESTEAEPKLVQSAKPVLEKKYFFDDFYDTVVIKLIQENIARISNLFEQKAVIEAGVNGTARFTRTAGDLLRRFQTGVVQFYVTVFAIGVTVLIYLAIMAGRL